ncbi:MAG: hypothetical protein IKD42_04410 [Kiritimatiellae bacterium]|nr:hypothetical protein [Kiritimatiellia bacterium]
MANLAQLRILETVSGFLPVDKPRGIAFSTVLKAVKRKFNLVKAGHCGALDAYASGLLVLAIGDANKFAADLMGADRRYEGTALVGRRTDTGDVYGNVLAETPFGGGAAEIEKAMAELKGDVFQTEPSACAVRREGSAAYETVSTGEHKPFLAHVYSFRAVSLAPAEGSLKRLSFTLSGTKGLLPRALVSDMGDILGVGASLETLRRTAVGPLDVSAAVPFEKVLETDASSFPSLVLPHMKVLG